VGRVFHHDRRFGVRGIPTHAPPPPRSPRGLGPAGGNEGRTASPVARDVARPYGRIGTCPARDNPVKGGGILQWLPHGNPDRPFSGIHAPPGAPGCPSNKGGCRRSRAKCFASNAPGASAASRSDSSPQPDCSDRAVWKDIAQRLLDDGCRIRTGRHEEDGWWPDFSRRRPVADLQCRATTRIITSFAKRRRSSVAMQQRPMLGRKLVVREERLFQTGSDFDCAKSIARMRRKKSLSHLMRRRKL
jgi:hypothetical protein